MDSLCNTQLINETLHQIYRLFYNNSSCIQLPEVIKVKQALKSLVSWLAATLEENYQNFEKFLHLTTFYNIRLGFFFSWHAASETTKFMPLRTVYIESTIQ